jgi:hypothetical protein
MQAKRVFRRRFGVAKKYKIRRKISTRTKRYGRIYKKGRKYGRKGLKYIKKYSKARKVRDDVQTSKDFMYWNCTNKEMIQGITAATATLAAPWAFITYTWNIGDFIDQRTIDRIYEGWRYMNFKSFNIKIKMLDQDLQRREGTVYGPGPIGRFQGSLLAYWDMSNRASETGFPYTTQYANWLELPNVKRLYSKGELNFRYTVPKHLRRWVQTEYYKNNYGIGSEINNYSLSSILNLAEAYYGVDSASNSVITQPYAAGGFEHAINLYPKLFYLIWPEAYLYAPGASMECEVTLTASLSVYSRRIAAVSAGLGNGTKRYKRPEQMDIDSDSSTDTIDIETISISPTTNSNKRFKNK